MDFKISFILIRKLSLPLLQVFGKGNFHSPRWSERLCGRVGLWRTVSLVTEW